MGLGIALLLGTLAFAEEEEGGDDSPRGGMLALDAGFGMQAQRFEDQVASSAGLAFGFTVGKTLTTHLGVGLRPSIDRASINSVVDDTGANVLPDRYKNQTTLFALGLGVPVHLYLTGTARNMVIASVEPKVSLQGAICCRTIDVSEDVLGPGVRVGARGSLVAVRRQGTMTGRAGVTLGAEYYPAPNGRTLIASGSFTVGQWSAPAFYDGQGAD